MAGSHTSHNAGQRIAPHMGRLQRVVYEAVKAAGVAGATRPEIHHATGLSENTVRPRVVELVEAGLLVEGGATRHDCAVLYVAEPAT